jgi:hypothetical protein
MNVLIPTMQAMDMKVFNVETYKRIIIISVSYGKRVADSIPYVLRKV